MREFLTMNIPPPDIAMPGRLFVLTGIDGAGKTTVLNHLARVRPEWHVGSYAPHTWLTDNALPHLQWMHDADYQTTVGRLGPKTRASFLGHLVLTHWECWLWPRLAQGYTVLLDSFFLRFWAREKAWGGAHEVLARLVGDLPCPEAVFLLDLPPETAATRKDTFDLCETGGLTVPAKSQPAFISFQGKVYAALCEACRRWAPSTIVLSATCPTENLARSIIDTIAAEEETP